MGEPRLTDKQKLFIAHYLDCLNATEAARRSGYSDPNTQGPRLLVNVGIRAAIDEGMRRLAMPRDEVVTRLAAIARADLRDLMEFDADGNMTGMKITRSTPTHLIKSITPTVAGTKIELHDAHAALVKLGEVYGLFKQGLEVSGGLEIKQFSQALEAAYADDDSDSADETADAH